MHNFNTTLQGESLNFLVAASAKHSKHSRSATKQLVAYKVFARTLKIAHQVPSEVYGYGSHSKRISLYSSITTDMGSLYIASIATSSTHNSWAQDYEVFFWARNQERAWWHCKDALPWVALVFASDLGSNTASEVISFSCLPDIFTCIYQFL